jgi:cbb3-type cytochrome oxidase subunit 3
MSSAGSWAYMVMPIVIIAGAYIAFRYSMRLDRLDDRR